MTAQAGEILILGGERTHMAFCPPLPHDTNRIAEQDAAKTYKGRKKRGKGRAPESVFIGTTACWRGYIGTWEIRESCLYLNELIGRYRLVEDAPLFADWFSGVLRVPQGKLLYGVRMGFGGVFEQELHIKIENGVVVRQRTLDNRGKSFDIDALALANLPGGENWFVGDDW